MKCGKVKKKRKEKFSQMCDCYSLFFFLTGQLTDAYSCTFILHLCSLCISTEYTEPSLLAY